MKPRRPPKTRTSLGAISDASWRRIGKLVESHQRDRVAYLREADEVTSSPAFVAGIVRAVSDPELLKRLVAEGRYPNAEAALRGEVTRRSELIATFVMDRAPNHSRDRADLEFEALKGHLPRLAPDRPRLDQTAALESPDSIPLAHLEKIAVERQTPATGQLLARFHEIEQGLFAMIRSGPSNNEIEQYRREQHTPAFNALGLAIRMCPECGRRFGVDHANADFCSESCSQKGRSRRARVRANERGAESCAAQDRAVNELRAPHLLKCKICRGGGSCSEWQDIEQEARDGEKPRSVRTTSSMDVESAERVRASEKHSGKRSKK